MLGAGVEGEREAMMGSIGIFDSGVGGLTVVSRVVESMPGVGIHYFGDTAHVPYGNRSADEVVALVTDITRYLVQEGAEIIIMACNTSSALALPHIRSMLSVPVLGIIEPAAKAAVRLTRNGKIGLLANPLTVHSRVYERLVEVQVVPLGGGETKGIRLYSVACPKLVPLVESARVRDSATRDVVRQYLLPLLEAEVDTLILGCTHYPFLLPLIREIAGERITVVDPAQYVMYELNRYCLQGEDSGARHRFEVSGDPQEFERVGSHLLGYRLSGVTRVCLAASERAAAS